MERKIFSRRLAVLLRCKGFKIVRTEPNFYKPQFDVYVFEDSNELQTALTEITQTK